MPDDLREPGRGYGRRAYGWVEIGAEEEGVPCRLVSGTAQTAVALAHAAALESRLGVGVGVAGGQVALHEMHMPPGQPVLLFEMGDPAPAVCRLMGGNAGRLVKRMPLRLALLAPPAAPPQAAPDTPDYRVLAAAISRVFRERGLA